MKLYNILLLFADTSIYNIVFLQTNTIQCYCPRSQYNILSPLKEPIQRIVDNMLFADNILQYIAI